MVGKNQISSKGLVVYEYIIFILYLCIGFIPNFEAVDKIAPQWLFMSLLNLSAGLYILKNKSFYSERISTHLNSWITLTYAFFIFWGGVSFFYAINPTEVIVNISRQFNVFWMFINMSILLLSIKNKSNFFSLVLTIILGIEVYAILNQGVEMINTTGQISPGFLKGLTANRNIAAFSIALKVPFVLFLTTKTNLKKTKILGIIVSSLAMIAISMIQSRASYLAIGLIVIVYVIMPFIYFKEKNIFFKLKMILNVIIPLITSVFINQLFFASKGADAITRASTISFSTNDGSINQRLRYYGHVLTHLKSNPILGVGLGNWKFKSIDYDKSTMDGYVVPYHAHSDFIQLGAELGVIGFLSYLGIFILAIFFSFKILVDSKLSREQKIFIYLTLLSLGVYLIDANLNFPIARPQVIIVWALIFSIISFYFHEELKLKRQSKSDLKNKLFLYSLLILSIPSLFVSFKVFGSLKNQTLLLRDFNSNKYYTKMNQIENMDLRVPNVTVTTIPLKAVKARYYLNNKQYDEALDALEGSSNANPYLFFTENMKSRVFQATGQIDSAYHYSKLAFFGLPNNSLHAANFVKLAMLKKDTITIEKAAGQLLDSQSPVNWQNIITANIDIVGYGNEKLMELTNRAVKLFPNNTNFLTLRKLAYVNPNNIKRGVELSRKATSYYNNNKFDEAIKLYLEAIKIDPMEYSYLENAASTFYQLKEYGNSMLYSSKVIGRFNPGTGKSEYIHGISKIATGDLKGGCDFVSKAIKMNFKDAIPTFNQFCLN